MINIMCGVFAVIYLAIIVWVVKDIRCYERMRKEFWRNVREKEGADK